MGLLEFERVKDIFKNLDLSDRKKILLALGQTLELNRELLKNAEFGPLVGKISKHTAELDGIIDNLNEGKLTKKSREYLFRLYKNLFLEYSPEPDLRIFRGILKDASSTSELPDLLKENASEALSELGEVGMESNFSPVFSMLPKPTQGLISNFLNPAAKSGSFASIFLGGGISGVGPGNPPLPVWPHIFQERKITSAPAQEMSLQSGVGLTIMVIGICSCWYGYNNHKEGYLFGGIILFLVGLLIIAIPH